MKIIIHVGLHRAASTSLQRWLEEAGPSLRRLGVYVAGPVSGRAAGAERFGFLAGKLLDDIGAQRAAQKLLGVLTELEADCHTVVLSDENLTGPMPGSRTPGFVALEPLREVIAAVGTTHRVLPVVILREHGSWLKSLYRVWQIRGETLDFADFVKAPGLQAIRYRSLIEALASAVPAGELIVDTLEQIAGDGGRAFLARFSEAVGGLAGTDPVMSARNASLPPFVCDLAMEVGRLGACLSGPTQEQFLDACRALPGDAEAVTSDVMEALVRQVRRKSPVIPQEITGAKRVQIANMLMKNREEEGPELLRWGQARRAVEAALARRGRPLLAPEDARALWDSFASDRAWLEAHHAIRWPEPEVISGQDISRLDLGGPLQ